jgi:hypothetical protein
MNCISNDHFKVNSTNYTKKYLGGRRWSILPIALIICKPIFFLSPQNIEGYEVFEQ